MFPLILSLLLLPPSQDVVEISATESLERAGGITTYSGNVVATFMDMRVEADLVTYNEVTQELTAGDVVTFARGEERLTGRRLELNLNTRTGVIREASGALGPGFLIDAAEVYRLEDGTYELIDATVTSCDEQGRKGWEIQTPRVRIDPEAEVRASGSVVRFEGLPVFYLPYLRTATEREPRVTGFLTPQTSTSTTKGRSIGESFFWAINRSTDLTVTGEYFTLRGMAGGARFRAVPDEESRIDIDNIFANDRKGEGGQRTQILAYTARSRLRAVADMNITSSFEFRRIFEDDFDLISSPIERSRAFATYTSPGVTYNFLYNRQGTFFVGQQTAILRKFPSLDVALHARPIGSTGLYFSVEGSVAGLHRRDAALESPALVGRVDLNPSLEIPLLRGAVASWSHRIGVRETFYSHSGENGEADPLNRLALEYGFDFMGPQLERQFGSWKHVIEPSVEYDFVTGVDRFDETLLVDETDLFTNRNQVRYGLTNRFFTDREVLSWSVSQQYFLDPSFGGALVLGRGNVFEPLLNLTGFGFADEPRRFSPVVSTIRFWPRPGTNADLQLDYDTKNKEFRSAGIIAQYRTGLAFYNMAYFIKRSSLAFPSSRNQIRATLGYGNQNRLGLNASVRLAYDVDQTLFQTTTALVSYNNDCYGLHLQFTHYDLGTRKESRIRFSFSLKNLGSIGTLGRPDALF